MEWLQIGIVAVVVSAAALYAGRSLIRGFRTGCGGGGCRCESPPSAADDRLGKRRELITLGSRHIQGSPSSGAGPGNEVIDGADEPVGDE